jgi:hypothetical protein
MRWRIDGPPEQLEDNVWIFTLRRRARSKRIRARVGPEEAALRDDTPASLARALVGRHLNDHVPPDEVSLVTGWDLVSQRPTTGEMGFTNATGMRMRWVALAQRLNLPHWLQPRR